MASRQLAHDSVGPEYFIHRQATRTQSDVIRLAFNKMMRPAPPECHGASRSGGYDACDECCTLDGIHGFLV